LPLPFLPTRKVTPRRRRQALKCEVHQELERLG
jgi:hypothetical protein